MTQEDPPRLLDESSELGRALKSAQADVLSPEAIARVRAGVVAGAASAPAASGLLGKTVLAALVVGASVGLYALTRPAAPSVPASPSAITAPEPVRAQPPPTDVALASASSSPSSLSSAQPSPTLMGSVAVLPIPEKTGPARARPAPQPSADAVTREGAILLEARRVLDSDPERALALVKKCETDFPDSQLAPERARIAAQAKQRMMK